MVPSNSRNGETKAAGPGTCCLDALSVSRPPLWHSVTQVVGAGTLPFAVPRLRSSVHDNVHRYDDIHSNLYTRVLMKFVKVSTVMD